MAMLFSNASAAGWGDLTVMSSLGQPLRAEIELISTSRQDDGPLTVKLAGFDAYRQANIEFNPVLMSLRFAVEQRGDKQFVRVTSTQPVNEPFVDMLLELSSGTGRVVREYVFLLDPASTDGSQMAVVAPVGDAVMHASAKTAPNAAPEAGKPAPQRPPVRVSAPEKQAEPKAARKPATSSTAASKPRLTLSGVTATSATDDKAGIIALEDYATMEKQVADANARVKALEQKVVELQNLLEVTNSLLAELQKQNEAAKAGATPAAPAPAPAAPPAAEAAPANQATPAPSPAPAPAAAMPPAPVKPAPVASPPSEEADYLIPGAALLVALLGAAGVYSARRRKARPSFAASQDDDPNDKSTTAVADEAATTALATGVLLPTELGQTHEVDPLAEADVYIAYGRDVQAEDILKEALNRQPERHPVRAKLLSIYAGRKDMQSFDALARELHGMTQGEGEAWAQAAELGRAIDPSNPLYAAQAEPPAPAMPEPALVLERLVEDEPPALARAEAAPAEPAAEIPLPDFVSDEDIDLAQASALPDAPSVAEEIRKSGPGPIDFDFIQSAEPAAESIASIPDIPVVMHDEPKAGGNLMEFDFLRPAAGAGDVPELPAAILEEAGQEAPKEEALLDFDFLKPGQAEDSDKRNT